jgi:hypothetical protein
MIERIIMQSERKILQITPANGWECAVCDSSGRKQE